MAQASSGARSRVARAPGDITLAALLVLSSVIERARAPRSGWVAAVPIIFVNYVAFRAQLRFWQDHLGRGDAFLVSAALESVAIYLAWQAHRALVKNDSALRLRLAAYGWAAGMGVLNYSHYMKPGWRPTAAAIVFGLMSAVSPWLWSIHSRRESRDDLKAQDLIDDHAVRLGFARWFWYPRRSAGVQRLAAWAGVTRPAEALALYETRQAEKKAARAEKHDEPAGGPARASVTALTDDDDDSPAGEAPPPVPLRREPRRVDPEQREARSGQGLAAASRERGQQVLAELLADPARELPSWRELSREKFGMDRSAAARWVLEQAKAARNGSGS